MTPFQVLVRAAGAPTTLALDVESSETAAEVVEKYAHATGKVYNNFRNVRQAVLPGINLSFVSKQSSN
jgi:hypothetical protein